MHKGKLYEYLSSQPFFKTPYELQNSKKNPRKMHFPTGFFLVGGSPTLPKKLDCSPHVPLTVLTQKCQICNFHAVFDHFVQTVLPPVDPILETLSSDLQT